MEQTATILRTLDEAEEKLRVGRGSIYRLINSGQLEIIKIGGRTFIDQAAIDRLIESGRRVIGAGDAP